MTTLRNLYRLLSPRERKQVLLLVPLLALTALVEVAGIASITPFLAIVADPGAVERHDLLRRAYELDFADSGRMDDLRSYGAQTSVPSHHLVDLQVGARRTKYTSNVPGFDRGVEEVHMSVRLGLGSADQLLHLGA
jgi:hypothetical protein